MEPPPPVLVVRASSDDDGITVRATVDDGVPAVLVIAAWTVVEETCAAWIAGPRDEPGVHGPVRQASITVIERRQVIHEPSAAERAAGADIERRDDPSAQPSYVVDRIELWSEPPPGLVDTDRGDTRCDGPLRPGPELLDAIRVEARRRLT